MLALRSEARTMSSTIWVPIPIASPSPTIASGR
jgi:hypothetical protein